MLTSSEDNSGLGETYFGQHMTTAELDAELLIRVEPARLKDLAQFNELAWFGYRFMHPGMRVFLFCHYYRRAYIRTGKMLGKKHARPKWLKGHPLDQARKGEATCLITATFTADAHGIPYEFWLEHMMELWLRAERDAPMQPAQLYLDKQISHVLDKWEERNKSGIYLAKADQYIITNYTGHRWQDAYQDHLCDLVEGKGNRAFWLGRLMFEIGHLRAPHAAKRFGWETVYEAKHITDPKTASFLP